jgi:hypothetical protein
MEEANWIAIPRVPLVTTEAVAAERGAATDMGGSGADAQHDDARVTEEVARPDTEAVRDDGAEGPSDDAECAVATVGTIVAASTSPGIAAAPDGDAFPAPDKDVRAATSAQGALGGDASEMVHVAELEAMLLAASSPKREAPPSPEPVGDEQTETPILTTEAKSLRGLEWLFCKQMVFFGVVVVIDTNTGCLCAGPLGGACPES